MLHFWLMMQRFSALQLSWAAPTPLNGINVNVIVLVIRLHSFNFRHIGSLRIHHLIKQKKFLNCMYTFMSVVNKEGKLALAK